MDELLWFIALTAGIVGGGAFWYYARRAKKELISDTSTDGDEGELKGS